MPRQYKRVTIFTSGKKRTVPLHRLLYLSWGNTIPTGWVVHHIDGNELNNSRANLIAVSRQDHGRLHSPAFRKGGRNQWLRRCSFCKKWLPLSKYYFYTCEGVRKPRPRTRCRDCDRIYIRRYMKHYRITHRALINAIALKSYHKCRARRRNAG